MPSVSRGVYRWLFHGSATLEDLADRLNHVWTVGLLLVLASVVSWRHTTTNSISCWTPQQFTGTMVSYTAAECWNKDVHYLPFDSMVPINMEDAIIKRNYAKWLPLLFCFQALLFKLPNLVLYVFHSYSGISFDKIADLTRGYENLNLHERQLLGRQISRYVYRWCRQCVGIPWRHLTLLWLLVKVLYFTNVIYQLVIFDGFIKPYSFLGGNRTVTSYMDVMVGNLLSNNASLWMESPVLPRKVLCDISLQLLSNVQRYTIRCYLQANVFNEGVCMFLWAWMLFVAIVTGLSIGIWFLDTLLPFGRKRYLEKFLDSSEYVDQHELSPSDIDRFCGILGQDGVSVLKLTSANSSDMLVQDVVCSMWFQWRGTSAGGTSGIVLGGPVTSQNIPAFAPP